MITNIKTVQLFVTCLVDQFYPEVGFATVEILEKLGLTVEFPRGQTCCGQPAFNGGFWDDARAMACHTVDLLSKSDAPVVIPSGSCADMIVNHYPELLAGDPNYGTKARDLAARTCELTQFLVDVLGVTDLEVGGSGSIAYHASCHGLRGLGLTAQPRQLLDNIRGIELKELPGAEECCGFGGLFAVKMGEISGAILERKLEDIKTSGAEIIAGTDVSCLMNIAGGLRRRDSNVQVRHVAELLRGEGNA